MLVRLKIFLAASGPAQGQFHRLPRPLLIRGMLGAFVKRHDDVGAQPDLRRHRALRGKEMRRSVEMRAESHAFLGHLAQFVQTENLETAGVGENRARPRHETVQPAQLAHLLDSRPQIKMVGIAQQNLYAEFLQNVLRHAFHRRQSSDRHEYRSFDYAMRSGQPPSAGRALGRFDLKGNGQPEDCSGISLRA